MQWISKEALHLCPYRSTLSSGVQSEGKGKTGDRQEGDRTKRSKEEERRHTFPEKKLPLGSFISSLSTV